MGLFTFYLYTQPDSAKRLDRLISRIQVGEVQKVDGQKFQQVKVIYNFVGEILEITK